MPVARIRTIKPEFWRSPDVMALDYFQRLLYIGLWNLADDEGRGVYDPTSIAADLFLTEFSLNPHGVVTDVSNAFTEYSNREMVTVYEVKNRRFFLINNWGSHQRINRPSKSKIPAPTSENTGITEPSLSAHGGLTPGTGNREQGTGNRDKDMSGSNEPDDPDPKPQPSSKPKKTRHQYSPEFEEFWKTWPNARGASKFETSKKFTTALKAADAETILAGARRFANDPNLDTGFCPMPTTWLHNRRWEAGPLPDFNSGKQKSTGQTSNNYEDWFGRPANPQPQHQSNPEIFGGDVIDHQEIF